MSWKPAVSEAPQQSRALGCSSPGGPEAAEGQRDGKPAGSGCPAQALQVLLETQRRKSAWGNALGGQRLAASSGKGRRAVKAVRGGEGRAPRAGGSPVPHGRRGPARRSPAAAGGRRSTAGSAAPARARTAPRPCADRAGSAGKRRQPSSGDMYGREKEKKQLYVFFPSVGCSLGVQ